MTVSLKVANIVWPLGTPAFFGAFFSTVAVHLEPGGWGTRFPGVMGALYSGALSAEDARRARRELDEIRIELRAFAAADVVWDIHDRAQRPPWGDDIAATITDLGNYFVTADGRDLFDVLGEAIDFCASSRSTLSVATIALEQ